MSKISCNAVRDLLPLYIDGVVSEETKSEVEKHLSECSECQNEYVLLKKEVVLPSNPDLRSESANALKTMKHKLTKKKIVISVVSVFVTLVLVATLFVGFNYSVIFQRGNPIPYLAAASQISDKNPVVAVEDDSSNSYIYITKNNMASQQAFLEYIETKFDSEYKDQYGSAYLFESAGEKITISDEVYWRYFRVWSVPQNIDKPTSDDK